MPNPIAAMFAPRHASGQVEGTCTACLSEDIRHEIASLALKSDFAVLAHLRAAESGTHPVTAPSAPGSRAPHIP